MMKMMRMKMVMMMMNAYCGPGTVLSHFHEIKTTTKFKNTGHDRDF